MSSAEPIGVAFVEIEPVATGFRAKTEGQIRSQLAGVGVGVPPSPRTTAATRQLQGLARAAGEARTAEISLAEAQALVVAANEREAASHGLAAGAARKHAIASREVSEALLAESASATGLRGASIGVNPAFLAATAAAIGFFKSAEEADKFAESMHLIEFATHATAGEMEQAEATARSYGDAIDIPGTSAVKAADAIQQLTHSGFDLANSQALARDTLLLSAAAQIDLGESTTTVARLLRAYNLDAAQAVEVTDALTAATLSGTGTTQEWAGALTTLAPLAHSLGLDVRETSTLLIQFAQGGVSASQATALLRLAFARIAAGSKPVVEGLENIHLKLGDLRDEAGNLRPDVFVVLGEAVKDLGTTQRQQALSAIFGARAGARLLPILDQTRAEYEESATSAQRLGLTQEEAEKRTESLAGHTRELKSDLSDLGVTTGRLAAGPLKALATGLALDVRFLDKVIGATESWTSKLIKLADGETLTGHSTFELGRSVGDFLDRTTDGIPVLDGFFETLDGGGDAAAEATKSLNRVKGTVDDLFAAFRAGGGGLVERNSLVVGLQALIESMDETTPSGRRAIAILNEVITKVQAGGKLPPIPISFDVDIDVQHEVDKARGAGDNVTKSFLQVTQAGATAIGAVGLQWINAITGGIDGGLPEITAAGKRTADTFTASLGTQFAQQQAAGASDSTLLDTLRAQRAEAVKRQARLQAKADAGGLAHPQARLTAGANAISAIDSQIESILAGQAADVRAAASDAKSKADEIERAADDRDSAFVAAIQAGIGTRQGSVAAKGATEALGDDIRSNVVLRNFLTTSIKRTQTRIREVRAAGRSAKDLVAELGDLRQAKNQVRAAIAALHADAKQQALDTRVESAQLDLQILEARVGDDPTAKQAGKLMAAHQRVIAALKRAQGLTKKRSVEWKRLQLEIAQEQAAIAALKNTQKKGQDAALGLKKQEFEFLQTIQGFSANVMGNLIPGFATAGTVGGQLTSGAGTTASGGSSPFVLPREQASGIGFPTQRGRAGPGAGPGAGSHRGVTTGQGNTQIRLLQEIRNTLHHQGRRSEHPEAHAQRARGSAALDYSYQGTHGM